VLLLVPAALPAVWSLGGVVPAAALVVSEELGLVADVAELLGLLEVEPDCGVAEADCE
jgi:L-serine deaminase